MKKGLLIILSGPSGVGKGTVRRYFENDERLNLAYSTSMTTREPRNGEIDGKDYFFYFTTKISKTPFKNGGLIGVGRVCRKLLWNTFKGSRIACAMKARMSFLEIEVQGATQVQEKCPDALKLSLSFLLQWRNWKDVFVVVARRLRKSFNSVLPRLAQEMKMVSSIQVYRMQ